MDDWDWKKIKRETLEAQRYDHALKVFLRERIKIVSADRKEIVIEHDGNTIKFFPYTGWHTGKSIKDGRGLKNLLKQLKNEKSIN